jgi:hypothetical protein
MQPTYRSITLQSGEALALDRQGSRTLLVTEGEVLLQGAAEWIAETVILPPPRRVVAPAVLACGAIHSLAAIGAAKIQIENAARPLDKLKAAWKDLRFGWLVGPRLSRE